MNSKILITGAGGNVGGELMRALPKESTRAADIAPDVIRHTLGNGVDVVRFDFGDPTTYAPALENVSRIFLLRPPAISDVPTYITPFIRAAKAAEVEQIVFLSIQGVENNRQVPHYKIEQAILDAGVPYTFLRCGFFMQNLATTHRDEIRNLHSINIPVGKSKTSLIDVRDIAAFAARTLTEQGHIGKAYTLTGSEALDYYQVAEIMTDVIGHPISYTNPSIPKFILQQRRSGRPWGMAMVMTMLYTITRFGNASEVCDDVPRLLGRPPISFRQFVEDYRSTWA